MILLTIFNHNAPLLMVCMAIAVLTALVGVSPQFNRNSGKGINGVLIFLITLFTTIFAIQSGDFVYVARILQTGKNFAHLEPFYQNLWFICLDNIIWRFVVFGCSVLLLFCTIRILPVNKKFAYFIFVITEFFYFGTMRNMFGFMVVFFTIAAFFKCINSKHVVIGVIVAAMGFWGASFLHRSMWMYLLLLIPALIPFGKRIIRLSVFAFPFIYSIIFLLTNFIISNIASDDIQNYALHYTDVERESTIMQTITELMRLLCYIYILYLIIQNYVRKRDIFPPVMNFLTRYAYILMYIGLLFYGHESGGWLYMRFVGAGQIALMFVMMCFFYRYPRTRGVKITFAGMIFFIIYQVLYICTWASEVFIGRFNSIEC